MLVVSTTLEGKQKRKSKRRCYHPSGSTTKPNCLSSSSSFIPPRSRLSISPNNTSCSGFKNKLPGLHTFQGDVGEEADRIKLVKWLKENFPKLNIFVANAGIMRRFNLASETESWKATQNEIRINLDSPIHFMYLLTPHFLKQPEVS